jgi:queuine tRNA-ribosyltransferase
MFDCVLPTRNGRNGTLFTRKGPLNITNARYREDFTPVDETCSCTTCRRTTRAYLRHLFLAKEILGLQLATHHNITFYQSLMTGAGLAIGRGGFDSWKQELLAELSGNPVLT